MSDYKVKECDRKCMMLKATGYLLSYRDLKMSQPEEIMHAHCLYFLEGLYECIFGQEVEYPPLDIVEKLKDL